MSPAQTFTILKILRTPKGFYIGYIYLYLLHYKSKLETLKIYSNLKNNELIIR